MLKIETKNFSQQEWSDIVSNFDDLNIMQTWAYGETKAQLQGWKVARQLFTRDGLIVGAGQAMVKTVPFLGKGLVWINRAPLWQRKEEANDQSILKEILVALRKHWVEKEKMYLRVAPTLINSLENAALLKNFGYNFLPDSHWISATLDLTKDEKALRCGLDKKWRNCLSKAEGLKIDCSIGTSEEFFEKAVNDYGIFLKNKNFKTSITPEFIEALQNNLSINNKMLVFSGEVDKKPLGSIIIVCYGKKAEYLIGAINEDGKRVNVGQFLLWRAICETKQRGFEIFDLGGAHPAKTPKGIMHFKEGLKGKPYKLVGEFEALKGVRAQIVKLIIKLLS
ncbi:MAG: peptidoglycan bridge formation glycyltransferase FemA/FemB family protein [bacterium]|nr:peptidoglycan bridge formation glycyltransferase FemA/FemB family protein [bacterium]